MTFNFYNLGSVHLFRCIFCHKLAKEPKMMSCMHTACYDCLRDKFKDGGVECIGCDAVNHVKDLSGFADQCYSRNILRAIEQMDVGEKFVHCFLCVKQLYENQMVFASLSRNAESTSSDCDGGDSPAASLNPYIDEKPQAQSIMCEGCLDEHWQQNPGHDIFACLATANGDSLLDETVRTASCVKHNKSYAIYCTKSKKSMCNSCLKSHNGSGHTHLTIDEVKSILKGKVDLEERFHTTFKSHTKSARLLKAALKTEEQNSIANMQKLFIKLKEKISEAEQLLKKKLQSFYSEKTAEIDQMLESSTYFESLGGRLFRTSDDLLSLSSDPEIFTFIAPLLALADQVSTFSSTTDEELRSVLKNKPYMAFNKKTFEDLLSVSFATIELQDVAFVDSLCCSVTENVEEQTTQICISSACESEAFVPENFKIELSVPGKASIALPVSVGNGETKSIEARLDSNLGVKPGLYKLNVTFQGAVVKNCPSHLKVFPNYSEGLFSKTLHKRVDALVITLADLDEVADLYDFDLTDTRRQIEELNLSDTDDVAIDDSASQAPSVSTFVSQNVRRIPTARRVSSTYQQAPPPFTPQGMGARSEVGSYASTAKGSATFIGDQVLYGSQQASSDNLEYRPSLPNHVNLPTGDVATERNNDGYSASVASASNGPAVIVKPEPIETFQFSAPFAQVNGKSMWHVKVRSDSFMNNANPNSNDETGPSSSSRGGRGNIFRDPAFPPPTVKTSSLRRADNTRIQMHHTYASQNTNSKRYYGHVSRLTPGRYPGHIFYSAEYKEALFYEKDIIVPGEASGGQKIRISDNVICNVVFENGIGFARDIRVLPFTVDAALVAKAIPHFMGVLQSFCPLSRKGLIVNEDNQTISFFENSISKDENNSSKQEKLKYFDLPDELSDVFRSRRKSKSNRSSPKYFPAPDEDFEMLPEDVAPCDIEETNTPRTTNSEKESFLKGTYDETCSSLNTTQNQRANYDDIYYGVLSELNLENQKITVMKAEQLTANEGAFNGQDGSPRVLKTIRIKRNSQQPVTEPSIESNIFGEDNYEAGEDYDEQHIYKNYYCDRFKFSTITGGVGIKKLATLGVKFKNSSKKGSFNYPIGCAVSRSDEVVICDHGNDRVQIFDINGKLKSSIGSNILIRPSAVVCAKNGGFAVRADNGIFFFDKDGGNLADRSIKSKFSKSCYGLVAHSDDNLMFLNLVKPQGSLVTVNWDGQFVSEDNFQPLSNATRPAKTKCRFMDSYGGCIFVSDLGASKIYITTPEGQTLQMFGSFGSKREEMNEPAGIKCTENFILVSDSKNNRLKVYDGKGETLSILTFPVGDVIKRPSDICFGSNNVLVVNSFLTHEVFIYRIEV